VSSAGVIFVGALASTFAGPCTISGGAASTCHRDMVQRFLGGRDCRSAIVSVNVTLRIAALNRARAPGAGGAASSVGVIIVKAPALVAVVACVVSAGDPLACAHSVAQFLGGTQMVMTRRDRASERYLALFVRGRRYRSCHRW
jgi:hypothetical protein